MSREPPAIDDKYWERLRYRGASIKEHVLAGFPESAAPLIGDRAWQSFKQQCAAEDNILPMLISRLEPLDAGPGMFQRRGPRKRKGSDPFADLPPIQRVEAGKKFARLCEKWGGNLPSWRRAILAGNARRLVLQPQGSAWGKRMRRIKGGVHCQRKYRELGWHPLAEFNQAMAKRRNEAAVACHPMTLAEEARARLGITAEQMRGIPKIARIQGCIGGGIERGIIEALRWSREDEALAFLQKYDSIAPADLEHLSIDEICVAAGIDPRRLLSLAVDGMMALSVLKTMAKLVVSLPDVADATIKNALKAKGYRDRRMILEITGVVPSARPRTGLVVLGNPLCKDEAAVRIPSLGEVLNRPPALPGKVG